MMNTRDIQRLEPGVLARLMELEEAGDGWSPEDLAGIFRHQLSLPLERELERLTLGRAAPPESLALSPARLSPTFGEVLHGVPADLELLIWIKSFAKLEWKAPDSQVPRELAIALYFLSIAAALVHADRRITSLDAVTLRHSFRSVLKAAWLDDESRRLMEEGVRRLDAVSKR